MTAPVIALWPFASDLRVMATVFTLTGFDVVVVEEGMREADHQGYDSLGLVTAQLEDDLEALVEHTPSTALVAFLLLKVLDCQAGLPLRGVLPHPGSPWKREGGGGRGGGGEGGLGGGGDDGLGGGGEGGGGDGGGGGGGLGGGGLGGFGGGGEGGFGGGGLGGFGGGGEGGFGGGGLGGFGGGKGGGGGDGGTTTVIPISKPPNPTSFHSYINA